MLHIFFFTSISVSVGSACGPLPQSHAIQACHVYDVLCLTHVKVAKARSMVSGKVQVLEVPYETPYIRDTSPLVSFVPTLTSVRTCCGQVLIITTSRGA